MKPADTNVYRQVAQDLWRSDGHVEFDADAQVSPSEDDGRRAQGAYVQSWHYISNEELAAYMADRLEGSGAQCEDLDDLVHTAAENMVATDAENPPDELNAQSVMASDANNEGLAGQCLFLIERLGAGEANELVTRLIAERQARHRQSSPHP